ncbi:threonine dehydratase biosynthetic, chloroplastic-like protein [Tanacetum coccineum]
MEKDRSLEESAASSYCNILNKSRRLGKELVLGYSYEKGHGTLEVDIDDGKADSALVEADVAKDKNDLILHLVVALAAKTLGCDDVIVMPVTTPRNQWFISGYQFRGCGETVVLEGDFVYKKHKSMPRNKVLVENRTLIHPFDHQDVISGHETVGDDAKIVPPIGKALSI